MEEPHEYRLTLHGTGPKSGRLAALQGEVPSIAVASPPEFGGPAGIWSPEHLFVAAVSSCLMTTFRAIAELSQLPVLEYSDEPSGRLVRDERGGYRMASVTLRPRVIVADDTKVERAYRLLEKAEKACLISRAISADIRMAASVETAATV